MDDLALLIDLHRPAARQGPGGDSETIQAISLSGLSGAKSLKIADIGCGTGASTRILAKELDAVVTAVDFLPEFLTELEQRVEDATEAVRIETLAASMDDLPFEESLFDAIWSEGAIYNIGFQNGIRTWRRFLRPGGIIAVSELTWLTAERPAELDDHWNRVYPEVATASAKLAVLEAQGYSPIDTSPFQRHAGWTTTTSPCSIGSRHSSQDTMPLWLRRPSSKQNKWKSVSTIGSQIS